MFNPKIAYAATSEAPKSFAELVARLVGFVDVITGILIGAAVVVFMWGIIQFLIAGGDKENIDVGKKRMFAGILGVFVIVAVWGVVKVVISIFGLGV